MDKSGRKFAKNCPKRPYTACNTWSNGPNEARNTNTKLSDPKQQTIEIEMTKNGQNDPKMGKNEPKMAISP